MAVAKLTLAATEGENPLSGMVDATFRQRDQSILLRESHLELANSLITLSGNIRDSIEVAARTTRFEDFLPALALVSESPETLIPVQLGTNGMARFEGRLHGDWSSPALEGDVSGRFIHYEARSVEDIAARVEASKSKVSVGSLVLRKEDAEIRGSFALPLRDWKPDKNGPLSANLSLSAKGIDGILREAGQKGLPIRGQPSAELTVRGSLDAPEATLHGVLKSGSIHGEPFDTIQSLPATPGTSCG